MRISFGGFFYRSVEFSWRGLCTSSRMLLVVAMEFEDVAGRCLCCELKVAGQSHGEANDGFRVLDVRSVLSGRLCIIRTVSF